MYVAGYEAGLENAANNSQAKPFVQLPADQSADNVVVGLLDSPAAGTANLHLGSDTSRSPIPIDEETYKAMNMCLPSQVMDTSLGSPVQSRDNLAAAPSPLKDTSNQSSPKPKKFTILGP